jgi:hypothetical protein
MLPTLDAACAQPKWPMRYECGFIAEKSLNGKSTSASCSLSPEIAFSTREPPRPPWDHCNVERVYGYSDLTIFVIDIERRTVSWTEQIGLIDSAKERQVAFYIEEEGMSKSAAERRVSTTIDPLRHHYQISHTEKIVDVLFYDEITGTLFDTPARFPARLIVFGDGSRNNFSLYVAGASDHAILSQYASIKEAAWVSLRFGRCRRID